MSRRDRVRGSPLSMTLLKFINSVAETKVSEHLRFADGQDMFNELQRQRFWSATIISVR